MEDEKKAGPNGKKDWLEKECEELGITYLGEIKTKIQGPEME